jgi:diketogulonate reductase-like aldo/keto reductase
VLNEVAKRHEATPRQVALAWLLRNESVFVIPKAAQLAHVIENAGAAKLQLTAEDFAALEAAFPRGPKPRQLPTA